MTCSISAGLRPVGSVELNGEIQWANRETKYTIHTKNTSTTVYNYKGVMKI
jgi:hypothetical protein